jgi:hypothetical protein
MQEDMQAFWGAATGQATKLSQHARDPRMDCRWDHIGLGGSGKGPVLGRQVREEPKGKAGCMGCLPPDSPRGASGLEPVPFAADAR